MARGLARTFGIWLALMTAESVHGALRTLFLAPRIGDFRARQTGVFTGSLMILAITSLFVRKLPSGRGALLAVGICWVILTIAFETVLGIYVFGFPWERLVADYDLSSGGLMPIGLAVLALAPSIASRLRGGR